MSPREENGLLSRVLSHRFVRFLMAGAVNAAFSYCCFALLMYLIGIKEIAVTLNLLISIFFNYNTSSRFVFKNEKMTLSQVVRFYAVYFVTYPLNLLHLHITVDVWGWNVYVSQLLTFLYLPFISYFLQKKLVFSGKPKEKS